MFSFQFQLKNLTSAFSVFIISSVLPQKVAISRFQDIYRERGAKPFPDCLLGGKKTKKNKVFLVLSFLLQI